MARHPRDRRERARSHARRQDPSLRQGRGRRPQERPEPRATAARSEREDRAVRRSRSAGCAAGGRQGRAMKLLYVEDNEDNVYVLKNRLSRAGHTVLIAGDGEQGIAMALSEKPDLILMDLSLP